MATKYLDKIGLAYFWSKIKAWCNSLFALDSTVVHKNDNEAIEGIKEFKNQYYDSLRPGQEDWESTSLILRIPNYDKGTIPETHYHGNIVVLDKDGTNIDWNGRLATFECGVDQNHIASGIATYKNEIIDGVDSRDRAILSIGFDANDIKYALAPSTSEDRTGGTDIVTRDWIPKDTRIVHTTGTDSLSGIKNINLGVAAGSGICLQDSIHFISSDSNFLQGVVPADDKNHFATVNFFDYAANGVDITTSNYKNYLTGIIQQALRTDGSFDSRIFSVGRIDGTYITSILGVGCDANGIKYANAPSTSLDRTASTDILTRDWIPKDTRIVHTTNAETISGIKTFLNILKIQQPYVTYGTTPSDTYYRDIQFTDSNDKVLSLIESTQYTNGASRLHLKVSPIVSSIGEHSASMNLYVTSAGTTQFQVVTPSIERNTVPDSDKSCWAPIIRDAADNYLGGVYYTYSTDKVTSTRLMCYKGINTTANNSWSYLGIGYDSSGNVYTYAPTPAINDNSTQIATTAFVRAQNYITSSSNITGTASNVTGTVAIANGGTGATTRLNAVKMLTNESVGTNATFFLTITDNWGKAGFTSVNQAKTVLGLSSYLPLTGGTVTDNIIAEGNSKGFVVKNSNYQLTLMIGSGGVNRGLWDTTLNKWLLYANASNVYLQGNATTASALETARTISLSGAATGSASFDGSSNIDIKLTNKACINRNSSSNPTAAPYYKIASAIYSGTSSANYNATFLIENVYSSTFVGILHVDVRFGNSGVSSANYVKARWKLGYTEDISVIVPENTVRDTVEIWAAINTQYMGYRATVIGEGTHVTLNSYWTLHSNTSTGSATLPTGWVIIPDYVTVDTFNDQIIGGNKIFENDISLIKSTPVAKIQISNLDTTLTSSTYTAASAIGFYDKNGLALKNRVSAIITGVSSNDENFISLSAYNPTVNSTAYNSVIVKYSRSGVCKATAPSTPLTGENIDIITRDFLAKNNGLVHNTGDETISGTKTFSSALIIPSDSNATIRTPNNTGRVIICAGSSGSSVNGAKIYLYSSGYSTNVTPGAFYLQTGDSNSYKQLIGRPDGTLTWDGQSISTSSDERIKTKLQSVPENILNAWEDVEWGEFKFLEAVADKGETARLHTGLIAQAIDRVFKAKNLDACKYGILCHEEREATEDESAIDMWTVRYTEALAMEAAYQRHKNKILENRISELEKRLAKLEGIM